MSGATAAVQRVFLVLRRLYDFFLRSMSLPKVRRCLLIIDIVMWSISIICIVLWLISLLIQPMAVPAKPDRPAPAIAQAGQFHHLGSSLSRGGRLAVLTLTQGATSRSTTQKLAPSQHARAERPSASDPLFGVFFATDPGLTYQNAIVMKLWQISLGIADSLFVLIFIIAGYSVMMGAVGFRYADAVETLPRIIMAVAAAHASLFIVSLFIGLNYSMVQIMSQQSNGLNVLQNIANPFSVSLFSLITGGVTIVTLVLEGVILVMSLMLFIQSVVRLMLIDFFAVLAPLGLGAWALPQGAGQQLSRAWFTGFIAVVMVQFLQTVGYILTQSMVNQILTNPVFAAVSGVLTGIGFGGGAMAQFLEVAVLWFVLRIPGMVQSAAVNMMGEGANSVVGAIQATISAVQSVVSTAAQVGMAFF